MVHLNQKPDPTLKEVRERCLEIQRGWSEHTRYVRLTRGQNKMKTLSARMCGKYFMEEVGYV